MPRKLLLFASSLAVAACVATSDGPGYETTTLVLPDGRPEAGRLAFVKLGCTSCHEVGWEQHFPAPVAQQPAPVFERALANLTAGSVAASILAPSHHVPAEIRAMSEGTLSPMPDFTESMTVRELVDIVAYLRTGGQKG